MSQTVRPESLRGPNPLSHYMNLTATASRVQSEDAHHSTKQHLETLRSGGRLDSIGHTPDWTERYSNPRSVALLGSFRPPGVGERAPIIEGNTNRILTRPESKSSGVVYTDAKRWYKMPPGMAEVIPKKLRLAPTARPQTVPASFDSYEPIPLSKRRFPDLNLPFSTVEQNPTANYVAIHSAMAHNVNNAIPNPLAASKAASRAAFFQSSSIAANASVATADGKLQSTSQVDTKGLAIAPTVTRLSPTSSATAKVGGSSGGGKGSSAAAAAPGAARPASSGSSGGGGGNGNDPHGTNAIPTRVNYKRRSFIARNFFHQEGVFESQSGVTNAYQYFRGSRPFGARPQTYQASRTTISGYPYDMYTKQL